MQRAPDRRLGNLVVDREIGQRLALGVALGYLELLARVELGLPAELRHYVDPVVVLELIQSWNIARCSPPLEADEIAAVVNSVCGLELKRRKAAA